MTRYKNYRKSAGLEGREFEISYEEFLEITQLVCFYCGAEPRNKFKARFEEFIYNGMDRIENSLGYTKENVVPCCWRCNRMKGPLSASEFISQCKKIWEYSHG